MKNNPLKVDGKGQRKVRRLAETKFTVEKLEERDVPATLTVITHGAEPAGQTPAWTLDLASAINDRTGLGMTQAQIENSVVKRAEATNNITTPDSKLLIFDWTDWSNDDHPGVADDDAVAGALAGAILLRLPANETLNLHLIGSGRGAYVVNDALRRLQDQASSFGLVQLTTLQPNAVNEPAVTGNHEGFQITPPGFVDWTDNYYFTLTASPRPAVDDALNIDVTQGAQNLPDSQLRTDEQLVREWYHWTVDADDSAPAPYLRDTSLRTTHDLFERDLLLASPTTTRNRVYPATADFDHDGELDDQERGAKIGYHYSLGDAFAPRNEAPGEGVDLVFVIDTTGSMFDDIDAVKQAAASMIGEFIQQVPDLRIGIVTYRDLPEFPYGNEGDYQSRTELALTNDMASVNRAIQEITVGGGGDQPESVFAGLTHAVAAQQGLGTWRGGQIRRHIILMGDAEAHAVEPGTGYTKFSTVLRAINKGPFDISVLAIGYDSQALSLFRSLAQIDGAGGGDRLPPPPVEESEGTYDADAESGVYRVASADAVVSALTSAFASIAASITGVSANIQNVRPDPRTTPVESLTVTFTKPVDGFDVSDLTLTRNGLAVDLAGVSITRVTGAVYRVHLGETTLLPGAYQLRLKADGAGITTEAGDSLTRVADEHWVQVRPRARVADILEDRDVAIPTPRSLGGAGMFLLDRDDSDGAELRRFDPRTGEIVANVVRDDWRLFARANDRTLVGDLNGDGVAEIIQIRRRDGDGPLEGVAIRIVDSQTGAVVRSFRFDSEIDRRPLTSLLRNLLDPEDVVFVGHFTRTDRLEILFFNRSTAKGEVALRVFDLTTGDVVDEAFHDGRTFAGWLDRTDELVAADTNQDGLDDLVFVNRVDNPQAFWETQFGFIGFVTLADLGGRAGGAVGFYRFFAWGYQRPGENRVFPGYDDIDDRVVVGRQQINGKMETILTLVNSSAADQAAYGLLAPIPLGAGSPDAFRLVNTVFHEESNRGAFTRASQFFMVDTDGDGSDEILSLGSGADGARMRMFQAFTGIGISDIVDEVTDPTGTEIRVVIRPTEGDTTAGIVMGAPDVVATGAVGIDDPIKPSKPTTIAKPTEDRRARSVVDHGVEEEG